MEKSQNKAYENKVLNKILTKVYLFTYLPLRVILYWLIGVHGYFYYSLYKEESEFVSSKTQYTIWVIGMVLVAQIFYFNAFCYL